MPAAATTLMPASTNADTASSTAFPDDKNTFSHEEVALWHSNYGTASNDVPKPDLVAPSIWIAAPLLPNTSVAHEAQEMFVRREQKDSSAHQRIAELKLITPHYQHVEGPSFAAPIVSSAIACMLEANPALSPLLVRDVLKETVHPNSKKRRATIHQPRESAVRSAAGRPARKTSGSAPVAMNGIRSTLEESAERAFTSGLKPNASRAHGGRRTRSGMRSSPLCPVSLNGH